ncbi:trypsin-like peptidase domain-containing protein [Actinosynnema pretiosum subsp. pretiosum]|uniref:Trypsin-like peptidase domain-containing protein n=1 Tax=Actinosynnema pretiosum subsp. pretiosum TaxID=103721 RepID=A0AA45LE93_9PSEU|nr:trypsin-like peptidase domain-containing protein [Actinosynnema pretiosum subsp. pretiosum]
MPFQAAQASQGGSTQGGSAQQITPGQRPFGEQPAQAGPFAGPGGRSTEQGVQVNAFGQPVQSDHAAGTAYGPPASGGFPGQHGGLGQSGGLGQPGGPGQPGSGPYYAVPGSDGQLPPQRAKSGGRGKVLAGVAALVLVVGGVAGGVGGYVGYQAAGGSGSVVNALNAAPPAQQTADAPAGSVEAVAQKVLPTVVQVQVSGGAGSGFVISSDGLVVTNNHVVESAARGGAVRVVFQDGRTASAKIIGRDPSSDLAVIKADGVSGLPTAELGNSSDLKIGQQVIAVGSPFDLTGTVTSGIVSSLNRPVRAGGESGSQSTVLNAVQTDAAINPGNSGGPLIDMNGRVIGINSAIYSPNSSQTSQGGSVGIGFAIPIDQARRTATELSETGKATQTVLGVQVTDAPQGGAAVQEVTEGGAAGQAGVKAGDVVTKFGDRRIDSSDALVAAVRSDTPGDKVTLTLADGRTVEVTLGSQEAPVN